MKLIEKITERIHSAIDNVTGEGTVFQDGDYWFDHWGNRWSVSNFSKEEAIAAAYSLRNCWGCTDCTDCADCVSCTYCTNCVNCKHCESCWHCQHCDMCTACEHSEGCTHCDQCDHIVCGVARQGKTMVNYVKAANDAAAKTENKEENKNE